MIKRSAIGVIAGLALGGTGIAIAQDQLDNESSTPISVASDAPAAPPRGPGNHGAAHQSSRTALRAHLEPSGAAYLANVDWDGARSFAIPGTRLHGWTFEQPGRRCLAVPDPIAEGYGVTCNTPEEVRAATELGARVILSDKDPPK